MRTKISSRISPRLQLTTNIFDLVALSAPLLISHQSNFRRLPPLGIPSFRYADVAEAHWIRPVKINLHYYGIIGASRGTTHKNTKVHIAFSALMQVKVAHGYD
jgi:hypothetical protein